MTVEEFKALPVGTLVKIYVDLDSKWEVGEILKTGQEVTIIWPESNITSHVGLTRAWEELIQYLEVDE